jgi:HAMP domain-containing protein
MKIQGKISLAMSAAFLVGLVMASIGAYFIVNRNAMEDSLQNARIMMEGAAAIRTYTSETVSPLLQQQMKVEFLPYAIPSFAAQTNFRLVQRKLPEYSYREPTLNPTNPSDKALDWEAGIINEFRDYPDTPELVTTRETPAGPFLTLARPLKVSSERCLVCHSTAEKAPPTMTALYGAQNGFGWKLGEIVGAQVVSIPLAVPLARAHRTFLLFVAALVGTFIVVIIIVYLLLSFIVVKPVKEISNMASEVSLGKLNTPELISHSKDEIGSLTASFNRMRRSLQESLKMLEMQG